MSQIIYASVTVAALVLLAIAMMIFRRVVPTGQVHIVQYKNKTIKYGQDEEAGNVYYEWPPFLPFIGVFVARIDGSIFQVGLTEFESYDKARVPFLSDVTAFFRISDPEVAAKRIVESGDIISHLENILRGSVRRVLSTTPIEEILEARSQLGAAFTNEVEMQLKDWGVVSVNTIEFMDIRDVKGEHVIANIMSKEKSRIERESREAVAENNRKAEMVEIEARRHVSLANNDAKMKVGVSAAESEKQVQLAREASEQEVLAARKATAEAEQAVTRVNNIQTAEIRREVAEIEAKESAKVAEITADGEKNATLRRAEAERDARIKEADGIRAIGSARAEAERAMLQAPVTAQVELAEKIGGNLAYQQYLITVKQVEVQRDIGVAMANAIGEADLRIVANAGSPSDGISKIADLFSANGGAQLGSMLTSLAATDEGKQMINGIVTKAVPAAVTGGVTTAVSGSEVVGAAAVLNG